MRAAIRIAAGIVVVAAAVWAARVGWSSATARFHRPAPTGGLVTVAVLDGSFSPAILTVQAGTTVRWISHSRILHTTTSFDGAWDSPGIEQDQKFSFTFVKAGEYRYLCRQHLLQGMTGTIVVK